MKKILLFHSLLSGTLTTLTLFALWLGQVAGSSQLQMTEDCHLPCWNGITPGETKVQDADVILRDLGYAQLDSNLTSIPGTLAYRNSQVAVCEVGLARVRQFSPTVSEITLHVCDGALLGHLVEDMGRPDGFIPLVSMVSYANGEVLAVLRSEICDTHLSPHNPLLFISLSRRAVATNSVARAELATEENSTSTLLPWRGYIPLWRYDQLFPGRVIC